MPDLPSEEMEAPESLNNSFPICIGNTLPAGRIAEYLFPISAILRGRVAVGCAAFEALAAPAGPA